MQKGLFLKKREKSETESWYRQFNSKIIEDLSNKKGRTKQKVRSKKESDQHASHHNVGPAGKKDEVMNWAVPELGSVSHPSFNNGSEVRARFAVSPEFCLVIHVNTDERPMQWGEVCI